MTAGVRDVGPEVCTGVCTTSQECPESHIREDLEVSRHLVVELLPKALGAAVGAGSGFIVAGPPGGIAGAVAGAVSEDALKQVNARVWGFCIDRLPFRSSRKLLARSVRAEYELRDQLGAELEKVWATVRK